MVDFPSSCFLNDIRKQYEYCPEWLGIDISTYVGYDEVHDAMVHVYEQWLQEALEGQGPFVELPLYES